MVIDSDRRVLVAVEFEDQYQAGLDDRMKKMINSGATVVFVSHSIEQVKQICKKALWLEHGNVKMLGDAETVCNRYMEM